MQCTALLDKLGLQNLRNPDFVSDVHSSISEYQKRFAVSSINIAKQSKTFDFHNVTDVKFDSIYTSLVDSLSFVDESSQNTVLYDKALQLLRWSQIKSNWNVIFAAKISDLDPTKFNSIINESKFDILNSLYFPYSIALNLLIQESVVAESIAEPILASFRYNFENPTSKLSRFSRIESSFLFIKLQFDLCLAALGRSWVTLEENRQILINNLKVANSIKLIDTLFEWKPIECVGLVLAKYFKKFILTRLSYFVYDYYIYSDSILEISELSNMTNFDDVMTIGVTKSSDKLKVCRVLIGGLFNLAVKWNEIDRSSMDLLRNDVVPCLNDSGVTVSVISFWQNLQSQVLEDFVPDIFDLGLIEGLKDLLCTSAKYCELLEQPELYIEATIGSFIDKTLELIKSKWNDIPNILDSIEESSKYLKIISDIAITCESSEIKSLLQLENVYSMKEKMHKIFILCVDEHLQSELKYLQKRILNLDLVEDRINILAKYTSTQSFNEIFENVASTTENTVLDYIIPTDNLMTIKSEACLELISENLTQLISVIPIEMPCVIELLYIFKHAHDDLDVDSFTALNSTQAEQAICQALHAKLDFQEFALLTKRSN